MIVFFANFTSLRLFFQRKLAFADRQGRKVRKVAYYKKTKRDGSVLKGMIVG